MGRHEQDLEYQLLEDICTCIPTLTSFETKGKRNGIFRTFQLQVELELHIQPSRFSEFKYLLSRFFFESVKTCLNKVGNYMALKMDGLHFLLVTTKAISRHYLLRHVFRSEKQGKIGLWGKYFNIFRVILHLSHPRYSDSWQRKPS